MKCPYCGYDKIQPNFNFCPKCKKPLTENVRHNESGQPQEKGFLNRAFSLWTYDRAMADPYAYAMWAYRNPHDNRVFLDRWRREGRELNMIERAIAAANRARQENPFVDNMEVEETIIDSNQQYGRQGANSTFTETVRSDYPTYAAAIVRNKAIWKLQAGELARHIAPDEWVYVTEHLEGLVIEEGTSAIIYVDGMEVAQMSSGMYVFDSKSSIAEDIEDSRGQNGRRGMFGGLADRLYCLISGHRYNETTQQKEDRHRRVQQIMGRLNKDTIIDVYLKSDRVFPVILGQQHVSDSSHEYQPYTIQSRYLDLQVGVSLQLQIGDFKDFIANYLAGIKTIGIADIAKNIDNAVWSILRYQLRDVEVSERGFDEHTFNTIKEHIQRNLPNILHGINVIEVLDIATSNEQLARFRDVEEQLYCSEREYDFLRRTNEFRNRIAAEENEQKLREARSEQELRYGLDSLNKDNLLHDDEIEQFVSLLMNQKAIREATNQAELDKALNGIERNKLVSREEFDIFTEDLQNRYFDRQQVSDQMRARSLMATALQKMEVDKTLQIANIQNVEAVSEVEFDAYRKQKGREAEGWDLEALIYGRQYVLEKQQLLDDIEKKRIKKIEEATIENQEGAVKIEGKRQDAEYDDERRLKEHGIDITIEDDVFLREQRKKDDEYARKLKEKEDNLRLQQQQMEAGLTHAEHMSNIALQNMKAMQEAELNLQKEQHSHEQTIASMEADVLKTEINAEKDMSEHQLTAKRIAQMDAKAQEKFAESFSHLNEIELTKVNAEQQAKLYEAMVNMAQSHNVDMKGLYGANSQQQMSVLQQMIDAFTRISSTQAGGQQDLIKTMVGAMQDVANGKINEVQNIKEEYRSQMQHEQERTDENQKQSLNYTTRVKMSENMPFVAGGTTINVSASNRTCPVCGKPVEDIDSKCCPYCGQDLK